MRWQRRKISAKGNAQGVGSGKDARATVTRPHAAKRCKLAQGSKYSSPIGGGAARAPWRLSVLLALSLAACAPVPASQESAQTAASEALRFDVTSASTARATTTAPEPLAPYEGADWPRYLYALELPRERDYVIVSYLPPAVAVDLRSPEAMRRTLTDGLTDPLGVVAAKTKLGHSIVAWQCGAAQGVTSFTGEDDGQALKMILSGWGVVPVLSTFEDGHLYTEAGFNPRHDRAMRSGKGVVTAVEVSRARCEGLRDALRRFLTHPDVPARNFGLLLDPARFEGAGCLSFAWFISGAAGVIGDMAPLYRRVVEVRAGQIGRGSALAASVVPWQPPGGLPEHRLSLASLLMSDWDEGPVADRLSLPDGEIFLAAMIAMRAGVAPADDWRPTRVLAAADPNVVRATTAAQRYAAGFAVRRIADPEGVAALVLERR